MKLKSILLCSALLTAAAAPAVADVPQGLRTFVGNWSCTSQMGSSTGKTTVQASLWGNWIVEQISYSGGMGEPPSNGTGYLGHDPKTGHWIYGEFDSTGDFFVSKSESLRAHNTTWHSVFPQMGDTTSIVVNGRNQYVVDVDYPQNGKQVTIHQVCNRV